MNSTSIPNHFCETKSLIKKLIWRKFCKISSEKKIQNYHTAHCGIYEIYVYMYFHQKIYISSNHLLCYFHEIFAKKQWEKIFVISTMMCTTATIFSQKFRECNFLLKNLTPNLFDEKMSHFSTLWNNSFIEYFRETTHFKTYISYIVFDITEFYSIW